MNNLNQDLLNNVLLCNEAGVKECLLKGANPHIQDEAGDSLLDLALDEENETLFDLLTASGATLFGTKEVVYADLSAIKESFKRKEVDEENLEDTDAFVTKRQEVIDYLKEGGDIQNVFRALTTSWEDSYQDSFARFLMKLGADKEDGTLFNNPLPPSLAKILLEEGLDCLKKENEGKSVLDRQVAAYEACSYDLMLRKKAVAVLREMEEHLKEKGILVPPMALSSNPRNDTSLSRAVFKGDKKVTDFLLAQDDLDINHKTAGGGKTALMLAVAAHDRVLVETLIAKKADINLQDYEGKTALMHAIENNFMVGVKQLLACKAKASLKDKQGYTALMHAIERNNLRAVIAFYQAGVTLTKEEKGHPYFKSRQVWHSCSLMNKLLTQLEKETKQKEKMASKQRLMAQQQFERE
ncbi:MAG: ankyrin repeat domain-containing protein [Alphaproteobacteria bacterium]|nr:ankyrin repeat domain-containing protein [Alphaproteobacteria bacterium]